MLNSFNWSLATLFQALGLVANGIYAVINASYALGAVGINVAAPSPQQQIRPNAELRVSDTSLATESKLLEDGVYLFGETPEPEQLGKAYVVFEVRHGRLIGAFYMPSSSFDCVYGTAKSQQLDLTIVNSYEQTTYPYSVPLQQLHPIRSVTANDRRILSTCTESYQEQVWKQPNPYQSNE